MTDANGSDTVSPAATPRLACLFCKKRKLKCNKQIPQCDSCIKYGFECEYEQPKEPTKKDTKSTLGNVSHTKKFEDRLDVQERVENLLLQVNSSNKRRWIEREPSDLTPGDDTVEIGSGLEFSQDDVKELENLFFTFVAPSINIIHESTHLKKCNLEPPERPPDFLRHAMCCLAASSSKTLSHLQDPLYQSSRRLLQEAEIKDLNFDKVSIVHAQTWIMIAVYELKECFLHRCLMSISRAVRLVQLLRLYCVDRTERLGTQQPKLVSLPADWLSAEERRRLFWFTFLMDRYTAISLGWPVLLDTRDIRTLLPITDEAYQNSIYESSMFLSEAAKWEKHHLLSNFAAQVVGVDLCHQRVQGLNRLEMSSNPEDWMGDSWSMYMQIENLLEGVYPIPQQLTIPPAKLTPSNVILNMAQAATIIMTHRIARFHLQLSPMSQDMLKIGAEMCAESAAVILRLMKMNSHWDVNMHHFCTSFCIYTAVLVYGAMWDADPNDITSRDSCRFLVDCLHKLTKATRLANSLLGDVEQELPGIQGRLRESTPDLDSFQKYINIHEHQPHDAESLAQQLLTEISANAVTAFDLASENSQLQNVSSDSTSWTVDDPDIASIGRFL